MESVGGSQLAEQRAAEVRDLLERYCEARNICGTGVCRYFSDATDIITSIASEGSKAAGRLLSSWNSKILYYHKGGYTDMCLINCAVYYLFRTLLGMLDEVTIFPLMQWINLWHRGAMSMFCNYGLGSELCATSRVADQYMRKQPP